MSFIIITGGKSQWHSKIWRNGEASRHHAEDRSPPLAEELNRHHAAARRSSNLTRCPVKPGGVYLCPHALLLVPVAHNR